MVGRIESPTPKQSQNFVFVDYGTMIAVSGQIGFKFDDKQSV